MLWGGCTLKTAVAQQYQRKTVMPEFFIPQQALPKPEKLPPIKFSTLAPNDNAIKKVSTKEQKSNRQSAIPAETLAEMPQYKQKYDEYIEDLDYIAETGEYPSNQGLQNDLAKMNSDEKLYIE